MIGRRWTVHVRGAAGRLRQVVDRCWHPQDRGAGRVLHRQHDRGEHVRSGAVDGLEQPIPVHRDKQYSGEHRCGFALDEAQSFFLEEINPGNSVEGKSVFDVPKGADPRAARTARLGVLRRGHGSDLSVLPGDGTPSISCRPSRQPGSSPIYEDAVWESGVRHRMGRTCHHHARTLGVARHSRYPVRDCERQGIKRHRLTLLLAGRLLDGAGSSARIERRTSNPWVGGSNPPRRAP